MSYSNWLREGAWQTLQLIEVPNYTGLASCITGSHITYSWIFKYLKYNSDIYLSTISLYAARYKIIQYASFPVIQQIKNQSDVYLTVHH